MTLATSGSQTARRTPPRSISPRMSDGRLYFFSEPDSQHSPDLHANPRAAAAIHPLVSGWQEIRGLQLRGRVRPVPAGRRMGARPGRLYQAKFPFVRRDLKEAVAHQHAVCVRAGLDPPGG